MAEVSQLSAGGVIYKMRDRNYVTCSTAAGTAAKTATLDGFVLKEGATVRVKFTNTNTASSPTLNISSTGAKPIVKYGTTAAGTTTMSSWFAGSVVTFTYDGSRWIMTDFADREDSSGAYTQGDGISIDNNVITNTGVRSVSESSTNGAISVNSNGTTGDVAVHGLAALAYKSSLTASEVGAIASHLKGAANGVAELDSTGRVPSTQLPSYVDDVIEGYYYNNKFYKESTHTTVITGETGKIYIDLSTEKTYRYSGSTFVVISDTLALGETSSTAYRGDRGATAYAHATDSNAVTSATETGLYKVGATANGHISEMEAITKSDITGLGIPAQDTTYENKTAASGGTDVSLVTTGDKYNWNNKTSNTGTVTQVSAGVGLNGGNITTSGTIKANLKSETPSTLTAAEMGSTSSRQYAVGLDSDDYLSVNVPWTDTWQAYSGATSQSDGTAGYVPAATAGNENKFFKADGTWALPDVGDASTVNGHTVESDVPSSAVFTDTVTTATTTGSGNAVTDITASNGALTITKGSSFITGVTGASPINVSGTTISHAASGVTAASKGDTANQTPTWGGTFKALSGTVDAKGHVTAFADHTVKIPNATASSSVNGLMSSTDKSKLDTLSVVRATISSVSSLPHTASYSGTSAGKITADHEVLHCVLSNPSAQTGDWTITTASNSITIAGDISGSTNITLYLAVPTATV